MSTLKKRFTVSYFTVFLGIFLFYIPFQERYTHCIKKIAYSFSTHDFGTYLNIDGSLSIFLTDILMAAIIFVSLFSNTWQSLFLEKSRKYLSLFLIISLISILKSSHGNESWSYFPYFFQLVLPALFFYALSCELNFKKTIHNGLWIIFFSALIECGIAIWQYFAQNMIGLQHLGEPSLFAIISVPDKTRWLLDRFFNMHAPSHEIFRASGTLPHPNILGCFLGFTLLISFYLYTLLEKKKSLPFFTLAFLIQIFTIFITFSRAALIGIFLTSFLWFCYFFYKRHPKAKPLFIKIVTCTLFSAFLVFPQLIERGGIVNYNSCAKNSDQTRIVYQTHALEKVKNHPLLGIGFHQYLAMKKDNQEKGDVVHNIFLLIATESGIIGLGIFLIFLISLFWHAVKAGLDPLSVTFMAILCFLLFVGLCHYDLMKSQQERLLFFLTCGFLALHGNKRKFFTEIEKEGGESNEI